jgi:hypothetical protein
LREEWRHKIKRDVFSVSCTSKYINPMITPTPVLSWSSTGLGVGLGVGFGVGLGVGRGVGAGVGT